MNHSILIRGVSVVALIFLFTLSACNDDDETGPSLNGNNTVYSLQEIGGSGIDGTVTFAELTDGSATIVLDLEGTTSGNLHPAHIHFNTASEGGGIAISLEPIDGASGSSTTLVSALDDGTAITYDQLILYDGYVNVHESETNLQSIVAQGDIGQNVLSGEQEVYDLAAMNSSGVSGSVIFYERLNHETLVELRVTGTSAGDMHPAHIHINTAAEGGSIAISLNDVNGANGLSLTNVTKLNDAAGGQTVDYDDLINYDGYINIHQSSEDLGTILSQGDIGQNALTGNEISYPIQEFDASGISGEVTLYERRNNESLVIITLIGTPVDGIHPAHIHRNTAIEGGDMAILLNPVNGTSGMSLTNVTNLVEGAGGDAVTYSDLVDFDGFVKIHQSEVDQETVLAQGDIGQNALTGEQTSYLLNEVNSSGVSGEAILRQRVNNETLIELILNGTPADGTHPAHIHMNSAAEGGDIAISLTPVDGASGYSATQVTAFDEAAGGTSVTYDDLLLYDGYINVHLSAAQLEIIVSQGDIGINAP